MTLQVGQRVQTPLGPATVLVFEVFGAGIKGDHNYVPCSLTDTDNGGRVYCQLDEPANWLLASEDQPHPYMFRSQLSELKE